MNWQKNTGVMPCDENAYVEVKTAEGTLIIGKARNFYWDTKPQQLITHYCIIEHVPFDYVEPKVWTVEDDDRTRTHVFKRNGVATLRVENLGWGYVSELLDALNAMEERNGTI